MCLPGPRWTQSRSLSTTWKALAWATLSRFVTAVFYSHSARQACWPPNWQYSEPTQPGYICTVSPHYAVSPVLLEDLAQLGLPRLLISVTFSVLPRPLYFPLSQHWALLHCSLHWNSFQSDQNFLPLGAEICSCIWSEEGREAGRKGGRDKYLGPIHSFSESSQARSSLLDLLFL